MKSFCTVEHRVLRHLSDGRAFEYYYDIYHSDISRLHFTFR